MTAILRESAALAINHCLADPVQTPHAATFDPVLAFLVHALSVYTVVNTPVVSQWTLIHVLPLAIHLSMVATLLISVVVTTAFLSLRVAFLQVASEKLETVTEPHDFLTAAA